MIDELTRQMTHLKNLSYGFYGIDISDIMVVDDTFIFCSCEHLMPIIENEIQFYAPIKTPYFSNPELNELTKLPAKIDYRSSYYSLGALILFCSTNIYIFSELKETDIILSPIYYTKLYWFLKRCFHEDCKQRILLFI